MKSAILGCPTYNKTWEYQNILIIQSSSFYFPKSNNGLQPLNKIQLRKNTRLVNEIQGETKMLTKVRVDCNGMPI